MSTLVVTGVQNRSGAKRDANSLHSSIFHLLLDDSWRIWRVLMVVALLAGCKGPSGAKEGGNGSARNANSVLVSEEQAQTIARRNAETMDGGSFEVQPARLVERRYWRIVVDLNKRDPSRHLTSVLPAVISKGEAEAIVREDAKARFGDTKLEVHPARAHSRPVLACGGSVASCVSGRILHIRRFR